MRIRLVSFAVSARCIAMMLALFSCAPESVLAQNVVHIDATEPVPKPTPVAAQLGSCRNPNGEIIGVNSQYLTLNGKPWLPVMGEFHFSRYPEAQWENEILKMKAAGVQIVSTYVIWIHHEQTEGVFDWSGQRDLRKFVQICGRNGMYVYPRIGPWAHAEVRNGGFPDWVVKRGAVRQNDPAYLGEVDKFYAQIARQLQGLLWKDGGPVIGIQIENEYHDTGPGKGMEHIRTLKRMAMDHGLDVPLYTITGWDGAAIPLNAVLPVFGGYPDAPWDGSSNKLPPNEVYAFRFANRAAGSMGTVGGGGQNAADSYRGTPFLTSEVGGGLEDTYFRRPLVSADDIASIAPVMLGSGVNLLGYYMFHGGRNPEGGAITLQESQRTGYPTDVPVRSYDFQAPLGEFGQERESLRKLKLVHYFLEDFGEVLAPMAPRTPNLLPANPSDLKVPRVAARTSGDTGFVFFNNHVRGVLTPSYAGFQVELQLPSGTMKIPEAPIELATGTYGIWPVNLSLGEVTLRYSTAQLFKRITLASQTYYFFFSVRGVRPEFAFDTQAHFEDVPANVKSWKTATGTHLGMRGDSEAVVRLPDGASLVLLPEARAEQVWRGGTPTVLLASSADVFSSVTTWTLQSGGNPDFSFGLLGGQKPVVGGERLKASESASLFTEYQIQVPAIDLKAKVVPVHGALPPLPVKTGPKFPWRPDPIPMAPDDADFEKAAVWDIAVPSVPPAPTVSDVFLRISYQGDVARIYRGGQLIDDNFWNGRPWELGLREIGSDWRKPTGLELRILPLTSHYTMYFEKAPNLPLASGSAGTFTSLELVPQYQVVVQVP
jgi:hypothetical protein